MTPADPVDIRLRRTTPADLPALHAFELDHASNALAGTRPRDWPTFLARWTLILAEPDAGPTGVTPRVILVHDRLVGAVNIAPQDDRPAIGYWIAREHWGRGIATRAVGLMLVEFAPRPIYATTSALNLPSIRVLEKNGFRALGRAATSETARTVARDTVTFALT